MAFEAQLFDYMKVTHVKRTQTRGLAQDIIKTWNVWLVSCPLSQVSFFFNRERSAGGRLAERDVILTIIIGSGFEPDLLYADFLVPDATICH